MAVSISAARKGTPWTLDNDWASTRKSARKSLESWPRLTSAPGPCRSARPRRPELAGERVEHGPGGRGPPTSLGPVPGERRRRSPQRSTPNRPPAPGHQPVSSSTSTSGMSRAMPAILFPPQVDHLLVIGRVIRDVPETVGLLEAADAGARDRGPPGAPRAGPTFRGLAGTARRPRSRRPRVWLVVEAKPGRSVGDRRCRQAPGLSPVRQVPVGEQDHRSSVLDGQPNGLDRCLEAV